MGVREPNTLSGKQAATGFHDSIEGNVFVAYKRIFSVLKGWLNLLLDDEHSLSKFCNVRGLSHGASIITKKRSFGRTGTSHNLFS